MRRNGSHTVKQSQTVALDTIPQQQSLPAPPTCRSMGCFALNKERNAATARKERFRKEINLVMSRNKHLFYNGMTNVTEYIDQLKDQETNSIGRRQQLRRKISFPHQYPSTY